MASDMESQDQLALLDQGDIDIGGVSHEWERDRFVRDTLRDSGSIICSEPGKYHANDSVPGVACNHRALAPIVTKLLMSDESDQEPILGMVNIPAVERELLVSTSGTGLFKGLGYNSQY